ncbi:XRE family transcriptional regulator [Vibrio rotiferianus]|uniref:XRE family transcriptional regulator n=1 Tax=Vibrio rotiferianus TaxID=190895 RepID=UPI00406A9A97
MDMSFSALAAMSSGGMLIERIEFLMAKNELTKGSLAKKAQLPRSSVYAKLDREGTSELTFSDLCAVAKAFDVSLLQLIPVSDQERKYAGRPVAKSSTIRMLDDLLSRPDEEVSLVYELDKLLRLYFENYRGNSDGID